MKTATLLATVSAASSKTSNYYDLVDLRCYAIQILLSGTDLAGTLTLEASIDATTWVTVSGSSQSITSSADHLYDVGQAGYRYVRCVWTYSSGTGNITVTIAVKDQVVSYA